MRKILFWLHLITGRDRRHPHFCDVGDGGAAHLRTADDRLGGPAQRARDSSAGRGAHSVIRTGGEVGRHSGGSHRPVRSWRTGGTGDGARPHDLCESVYRRRHRSAGKQCPCFFHRHESVAPLVRDRQGGARTHGANLGCGKCVVLCPRAVGAVFVVAQENDRGVTFAPSCGSGANFRARPGTSTGTTPSGCG